MGGHHYRLLEIQNIPKWNEVEYDITSKIQMNMRLMISMAISSDVIAKAVL